MFKTMTPTPSFLDKETEARGAEASAKSGIAVGMYNTLLPPKPDNIQSECYLEDPITFFSVSKDVQGGNKKIVGTAKSLQEGSDKIGC